MAHSKSRAAAQTAAIVLVSILFAFAAAELYLSRRAAQRAPLPFYNKLYPYVMFRPAENAVFETLETYEMSRHKSRAFVYTNEDGFRIPKPGYELPRRKPAGQLRVAFLGGSLVQLASTYDVTLPGALRTLLRQRYPGRDIEVINAGIQSCVSRQSLVQLLLTVVDYQPDIVILYDGGNDLGLPFTYESRPNFPYNFQTMEEAWDLYRNERRQPLWRIAAERSEVYRLLRSALDPGSRKLVPTADDPFAGTNAVPASRILADKEFAPRQVAEYLTNWRKVIELAAAYGYDPVLIQSATAGLNRAFAVPRMMKSFKLDEPTAHRWIDAFDLLYAETARQMDAMRAQYPRARFLNLVRALEPPETYFWDLVHVYDDSNAVLAARVYAEIRPLVEARLK